MRDLPKRFPIGRLVVMTQFSLRRGGLKSPRQLIMTGLMALAVAIALCGAGCREKEAPTTVDSKPFEAAITEYLHNSSYGMKIASVQSIDQKANTATVVCKMQEAEGTYGLTVTWEFTFRRTNGNWQVVKQTTK